MTHVLSRLTALSALLLWIGCAETPERVAVKQTDALLDQGRVQAALDVVEGYLRRHPESVPLLRMQVVVLLRAERPAMALQALQGVPGGRAFLSGLLRHRDVVVRVNSAKLIADRPVKGDFHELVRASEDPDPNVRRYCAQALGELKNPDALKPLFRLLGDDNWFVRAETATALGRIGDPRGVGWLIQLLADDDGYVRYNATSALYEMASDSTRLLLKRGLDSAKPEQQFGIAKALAKLNDPAAVGPLTAALQDKGADVRCQAAEGLAECGQPEATNALSLLLEDPDPKVRTQAAGSLEKLKLKTTNHTVIADRLAVSERRGGNN